MRTRLENCRLMLLRSNMMMRKPCLTPGSIQKPLRIGIWGLYVDSFFVGEGIGGELVEYAKRTLDGRFLWVLERNERAIRFYMRHGFVLSGERIPEPDTEEYLVRLEWHED